MLKLLIHMQRRMFGVLFCLFLMNISFSQSMKEIAGDQFDKIASVPTKDKAFTISAFLGNRVFVLQQAKDSILAFCYKTAGNNAISGVSSILVNDDTLFVKAVQTLFNDVKQNHIYQAYSKQALANGNFFLTFNDRNKLQMYSRKEASPAQQKNINFILGRLNRSSSALYNGHGARMNPLDITNLNEFLKQLK